MCSLLRDESVSEKQTPFVFGLTNFALLIKTPAQLRSICQTFFQHQKRNMNVLTGPQPGWGRRGCYLRFFGFFSVLFCFVFIFFLAQSTIQNWAQFEFTWTSKDVAASICQIWLWLCMNIVGYWELFSTTHTVEILETFLCLKIWYYTEATKDQFTWVLKLNSLHF